MQTCLFSEDTESQLSEYYIFHDPIDKVYNAYTNINVMTSIFKNQFTVISLKRPTTLDDEGNEFTIKIMNLHSFSFLVENCHKTPNCHYTFTLKCIYYPSFFCSFDITINFYWDTIAHVTVFQGEITFDDSRYQENMLTAIKSKLKFPNEQIQEYLKQTIKNLEESESISINANFDFVWNFISNVKNLNYFFPFKNVEIKSFNNESLITIFDPSSKNEIKLNRTEIINEMETKRELKLEMFDSVIPMPKQLIEIAAIKIKDNVTFIIFKHTVLEYILYDVLKSNSINKQKILRRIKKRIELNESSVNGLDINNTSINSNDEDVKMKRKFTK
jgi:hypothetical protein